MITTTYRDYEIEYLEGANCWKMTADEKTFNSLSDAKNFIDTLYKPDKFDSFPVMIKEYNHGLVIVDVVSIDKVGAYWTKDSEGNRRKYLHRETCKCSEKNLQKKKEIEKKKKAKMKIEKEINVLFSEIK